MSQNRQQVMNGRSLETPGLQAWVLNLRFGHRDQFVSVSKSILVIPSSPGRTEIRILLWNFHWTVCWSSRLLVSTTTQGVTEVWQRRRAAAQLNRRQPATCPKRPIHPHAQLLGRQQPGTSFPDLSLRRGGLSRHCHSHGPLSRGAWRVRVTFWLGCSS